ncbi:hypothetical protein XH79_06725, partial [Bradyrhizobium sp. CCBAU 45389]|nr:hypothetical protein [Bradyrhizobium sp. CCBAU 45389]
NDGLKRRDTVFGFPQRICSPEKVSLHLCIFTRGCKPLHSMLSLIKSVLMTKKVDHDSFSPIGDLQARQYLM